MIFIFMTGMRKATGINGTVSHIRSGQQEMRTGFHIGKREQQIIESHMWPLTLRHVPETREAAIVCIADKCCSFYETVRR